MRDTIDAAVWKQKMRILQDSLKEKVER